MYAGHLQALSVGAQDEAGLAGPLQDGPEEAEEEKPREELVQVRGQGERGETAGVQSPNTTVLQLCEILQDLVPIHNQIQIQGQYHQYKYSFIYFLDS